MMKQYDKLQNNENSIEQIFELLMVLKPASNLLTSTNYFMLMTFCKDKLLHTFNKRKLS